MTLGEKIKALRTSQNLTQMDLSVISGITERTIYTFECKESHPRRSSINKLAKALNVSPDFLMDDTQDDPGLAVDQESFYRKAKELYGYRGMKQAKELMKDSGALFAGGTVDDTAKKVVMDALIELFFLAKKEAHDKFTPRKYRNHHRNSEEGR